MLPLLATENVLSLFPDSVELEFFSRSSTPELIFSATVNTPARCPDTVGSEFLSCSSLPVLIFLALQ